MSLGFLKQERNRTNPNDFDMDTERLPWYHIGVVEEISSIPILFAFASLLWRFFCFILPK